MNPYRKTENTTKQQYTPVYKVKPQRISQVRSPENNNSNTKTATLNNNLNSYRSNESLFASKNNQWKKPINNSVEFSQISSNFTPNSVNNGSKKFLFDKNEMNAEFKENNYHHYMPSTESAKTQSSTNIGFKLIEPKFKKKNVNIIIEKSIEFPINLSNRNVPIMSPSPRGVIKINNFDFKNTKDYNLSVSKEFYFNKLFSQKQILYKIEKIQKWWKSALKKKPAIVLQKFIKGFLYRKKFRKYAYFCLMLQLKLHGLDSLIKNKIKFIVFEKLIMIKDSNLNLNNNRNNNKFKNLELDNQMVFSCINFSTMIQMVKKKVVPPFVLYTKEIKKSENIISESSFTIINSSLSLMSENNKIQKSLEIENQNIFELVVIEKKFKKKIVKIIKKGGEIVKIDNLTINNNTTTENNFLCEQNAERVKSLKINQLPQKIYFKPNLCLLNTNFSKINDSSIVLKKVIIIQNFWRTINNKNKNNFKIILKNKYRPLSQPIFITKKVNKSNEKILKLQKYVRLFLKYVRTNKKVIRKKINSTALVCKKTTKSTYPIFLINILIRKFRKILANKKKSQDKDEEIKINKKLVFPPFSITKNIVSVVNLFKIIKLQEKWKRIIKRNITKKLFKPLFFVNKNIENVCNYSVFGIIKESKSIKIDFVPSPIYIIDGTNKIKIKQLNEPFFSKKANLTKQYFIHNKIKKLQKYIKKFLIKMKFFQTIKKLNIKNGILKKHTIAPFSSSKKVKTNFDIFLIAKIITKFKKFKKNIQIKI